MIRSLLNRDKDDFAYDISYFLELIPPLTFKSLQYFKVHTTIGEEADLIERIFNNSGEVTFAIFKTNSNMKGRKIIKFDMNEIKLEAEVPFISSDLIALF